MLRTRTRTRIRTCARTRARTRAHATCTCTTSTCHIHARAGRRLPRIGGGRRVRTRAARRARRLLGPRRFRDGGAPPRRARLHETHAGAAWLRRILRRGAAAARGWLERQGRREGRQQGQEAAGEIDRKEIRCRGGQFVCWFLRSTQYSLSGPVPCALCAPWSVQGGGVVLDLVRRRDTGATSAVRRGAVAGPGAAAGPRGATPVPALSAVSRGGVSPHAPGKSENEKSPRPRPRARVASATGKHALRRNHTRPPMFTLHTRHTQSQLTGQPERVYRTCT